MIIFDLDGTLILPMDEARRHLIHSYTDFRRKLMEKAAEFGIPRDEYIGNDYRMALIYNRTREIVSRSGFSKERASIIMKALSEIIAAEEKQEHETSVALPGASETLKALKESGHELGIVTNTSESELLGILERFGFREYFDRYVTREHVEYLKPNPELVLRILNESGARDFFYVGDADLDVEAAGSACRLLGVRCTFILINTRGYDETAIASMRPEKVIDSLKELLCILPSSG